MIRLEDNIQDNELRVLGKPSPENPKKRNRKWYYAIVLLMILLGVIYAATHLTVIRHDEIVPDFYETESVERIETSEPVPEKLGDYTDSSKAYPEDDKRYPSRYLQSSQYDPAPIHRYSRFERQEHRIHHPSC